MCQQTNDNPSITIAFVGDTSPRWGIDSVGVVGITITRIDGTVKK